MDFGNVQYYQSSWKGSPCQDKYNKQKPKHLCYYLLFRIALTAELVTTKTSSDSPFKN